MEELRVCEFQPAAGFGDRPLMGAEGSPEWGEKHACKVDCVFVFSVTSDLRDPGVGLGSAMVHTLGESRKGIGHDRSGIALAL